MNEDELVVDKQRATNHLGSEVARHQPVRGIGSFGFDSRRLHQTSLSSGLPLSSESYVSASRPRAKSAAPKLWEDEVEPDHSEGGQAPRRLAGRLLANLGMPLARGAQKRESRDFETAAERRERGHF